MVFDRILAWLLILIYGLTTVAAPAHRPESERIARDVMASLNGITTTALLIQRFPADFRSRNQDYLESLSRKYGFTPLPTVKQTGDTLTLELGHRSIPIKIVDGSRSLFLINNHPYQFDEAKPLEISLSEIKSLMKESRRFSFDGFFYSDAHAAAVILWILGALIVAAIAAEIPQLHANYKRVEVMTQILHLCGDLRSKIQGGAHDLSVRDLEPLRLNTSQLLSLFKDSGARAEMTVAAEIPALHSNWLKIQSHHLCDEAKSGLGPSKVICEESGPLTACLNSVDGALAELQKNSGGPSGPLNQSAH